MTVPVLAVVGHPNKGKSSLVATLARDDRIAISAHPGTTEHAARYPMRVDGETLYELVDTPGFQRARGVLAWLRANASSAAERPQAVRRFIEEHRARGEFRDECELLAPIVDGAGVLYVVDGAGPYASEYEPEMEVLRWCGRPSMAVINPIGEAEFTEEWRRALHQYFRSVRVVDVLESDFHTHLELLRAVGGLDEGWREPMALAVAALAHERARQRAASASAVADLLGQALALSMSETRDPAADLDSVRARLQGRYREALRALERGEREAVEEIYAHHGTRRREAPLELLAADLFAQHVWQVFALPPWKMALIGSASGAAAGTVVDALSGGASLMLGALLGAVAGGVVGWSGTDQLAKLETRHLELGQEKLRCGPAANVNIGFVLLGRARLHHRVVAGRNHAQRAPLDLAGIAAAQPLPADEERWYARRFDRLRGTDPDTDEARRARDALADRLDALLALDLGEPPASA